MEKHKRKPETVKEKSNKLQYIKTTAVCYKKIKVLVLIKNVKVICSIVSGEPYTVCVCMHTCSCTHTFLGTLTRAGGVPCKGVNSNVMKLAGVAA